MAERTDHGREGGKRSGILPPDFENRLTSFAYPACLQGVPVRREVWVDFGEVTEGWLQTNRFTEEVVGFLQATFLSGVAGEVEPNQRDGGESLAGFLQNGFGCLDGLRPTNGVREADPELRLGVVNGQQLPEDSFGFGPLARGLVHLAADEQDFCAGLVGRRDFLKSRYRLGVFVQQQPTLRALKVFGEIESGLAGRHVRLIAKKMTGERDS